MGSKISTSSRSSVEVMSNSSVQEEEDIGDEDERYFNIGAKETMELPPFSYRQGRYNKWLSTFKWPKTILGSDGKPNVIMTIGSASLRLDPLSIDEGVALFVFQISASKDTHGVGLSTYKWPLKCMANPTEVTMKYLCSSEEAEIVLLAQDSALNVLNNQAWTCFIIWIDSTCERRMHESFAQLAPEMSKNQSKFKYLKHAFDFHAGQSFSFTFLASRPTQGSPLASDLSTLLRLALPGSRRSIRHCIVCHRSS